MERAVKFVSFKETLQTAGGNRFLVIDAASSNEARIEPKPRKVTNGPQKRKGLARRATAWTKRANVSMWIAIVSLLIGVLFLSR